jgi:cyclophilin family peptidyl-prolyl cis-trans isomerase/protein-disulfide isomerase
MDDFVRRVKKGNSIKEKMQKISLSLISMSLLISACATAATPATPSAMPATQTPTINIPTPTATKPACTSLEVKPTPGPEEPSLFRAVSTEDNIRGSDDPIVTIMVYDEFQCTQCNYLPLSQKLLENYPDVVRIVYRYYPYTSKFDKGELAARAAEAAANQGKFWEMHDLLFEKQEDWVELTIETFEKWVTARAEELELDTAQFWTDFNSSETIERVQNAAQEGEEIGIPRLPFFLLNGQIYSGATDYESFSQIINLIELGERQFTECPPILLKEGKQYFATLHTEKGDIVLLLFPEKAPMAVNSFVFLAQQGWFDNITFHRVLPGFVAQTGDPSGTGQGNPGYTFNNEIDPSLKFDQAGLVGMANSGPDTNGSQFFITYGPAPHLNDSYTIFGRVLDGMDVLEQLTPRDPQPGLSLPLGDKLITVTIEEK